MKTIIKINFIVYLQNFIKKKKTSCFFPCFGLPLCKWSKLKEGIWNILFWIQIINHNMLVYKIMILLPWSTRLNWAPLKWYHLKYLSQKFRHNMIINWNSLFLFFYVVYIWIQFLFSSFRFIFCLDQKKKKIHIQSPMIQINEIIRV